MKKLYYAFIALFFFYQVSGQNARVGINTTTPLARLHVADSSVVFTQAALSTNTAVAVSGPGVRMMWYPGRAAFRAGDVSGTEWNRDSIGNNSIAIGHNTVASGLGGVAMGYECKARGSYATAFGSFSIASADAFAAGSGKALGTNSFAIGIECISSNDYSFASGYHSLASGYNSVALGQFAKASGYASVSLGENNVVSGDNAFSTGFANKSSGEFASSIGHSLIANSYSSFVVGWFNDTTSISSTNWNPSDPLFVVGNGQSISNRMNALTVLKNANTGIGTASPQRLLHIKAGESGGPFNSSSVMMLEDDTNCHIQFSVPNNADAGLLSGNAQTAIRSAILFKADSSIYFRSGGLTTTKLDIDANGNIGINTTAPTEKLHVVGNGKFTGTVTASCGTLSCSDMRYKKNVTPLSNALNDILALHGFYYYWDKEKFPDKGFNDQRQIGVSAQEVEAIFPELVKTEEDGYKLVDYSRLSPILIEAVKAQQTEIRDLKSGLAVQQSQIDELKQLVLKLSSALASKK